MAVQIVYSSRRGSREIEHIRSAHEDAELKAAARQLMAAVQQEFGLRLGQWDRPGCCRSPSWSALKKNDRSMRKITGQIGEKGWRSAGQRLAVGQVFENLQLLHGADLKIIGP
jgi:hypothetical protein